MDEEYLKSIGITDAEISSKIIAAHKEHEAGLVTKRDELLGLTAKQKADLDKIEKEFKETKKQLADKAAESLTAEEKIELARKEAAEEWQAKYSEAETKLKEFDAKERQRMISEGVFRSVGDKGDADVILDVISQKKLVDTVDKEGKYSLKVLSLDGKTELESVDKLIELMKASEKYGRLFNSSGLSGGGSRNSAVKTGIDKGLFGAAKIRAARGG